MRWEQNCCLSLWDSEVFVDVGVRTVQLLHEVFSNMKINTIISKIPWFVNEMVRFVII